VHTTLFCPIAILATVSVLCSGQSPGANGCKEYPSPDRAFKAFVCPSGNDESRVFVASGKVNIFCQQDYSSYDRSHGFAVVKASWTPDSNFFVYSLESSGGHSVMVVPIVFCSRKREKAFDVGELLGDNVMLPDFRVSAPDIIHVSLQTSPHDKTVSLSRLEKSAKAKAKE
jgi:hypothetical protein